MKHLLTLAVTAATAALCAGCSGAAGSNAPREDVVYVCTETRRVVTGPLETTPALNPETGRRTLMPGLYCTKCRAWHPSAPLEIAQRNPASRRCPKHRIPMEMKEPVAQ